MKNALLFLLFAIFTFALKAQPYISEIDYDQPSQDDAEFIEIYFPSGFDKDNFYLFLYSGNDGTPYGIHHLASNTTCAAQDGGNLCVWDPGGLNNLQNGDKEGIVLYDSLNHVIVQMLAYEGSFMATSGPASGLMLPNLPVQDFNDAPNISLQFNQLTNTWTTGTPNPTILPVLISKMELTLYNKKPQLSWTTSSEINNSHFEIQRSKDGSHFESIGRVDAQNTRGQDKDYDYTDQQPNHGVSYYRLKQVDLDGKATIFETLTIDIRSLDSRIYPTNVSQQLFLNQELVGQSYIIFNTTGSVVSQSTTNDNTLDVSQLNSGMYIIRFRDESHKFIKI